MEAHRKNELLPFQLWEPFAWEYTSAISSLLLFPLLFILLKKVPLSWQRIKFCLTFYFLASIIFSLAHTLIMVALRKVIYFATAGDYNFGDIGFELLYEYRKDLWSFIFFVIFIQGYNFILSRLQGEANPVAQSEQEADTPPESQVIDRLLVKKLGKEFIIKVEDVEWLESAGNYVNLHIAGRIYPLRATLRDLITKISDKGFSRIHRSHAINLNYVESITPLSSGDSEVKLTTGKVLNLSRRYKESFKGLL